jgi:uncharacterized membrane protein HdeD (DUF308 family)
MSRTELVIRLVLFLPLLFIAYQVIMLRRILASRAWTLLALGFSLIAILRGVLLFYQPPHIPTLVVTLVAFSAIASGFHVMHQDLQRVMRAYETRGH